MFVNYNFIYSNLGEKKPNYGKCKFKTLTDLPEELLLHVATYLTGRDVVNLSHVNQVINDVIKKIPLH